MLALDIFLIQAGANTMLAHWLGAAISLWLLRTVNLPSPGNAKCGDGCAIAGAS